MKILIVTSNYPPIITAGGSVYFKTLTDRFKGSGHFKRVIVLTEFVSGCKLVTQDRCVSVFRCLFPKAARNRTKRWGILMRVFCLIYNQTVIALLLPLLSLVYRPRVIHLHASFFKLGRLRDDYNYFLHYILLSIKKLSISMILIDVRGLGLCFPNYNDFDKVVCCSENTFKKCLEIGIEENKCVLIPIPFEMPDIKSLEDMDTSQFVPYICFAARIEEAKGIFELIDAFIELNGYKDLNLLVIGVNLEGDRFIKRISNCNRVYYLGSKCQNEVVSIMSEAELVVLPSKSEGLPRSCLEAIAVGSKVLLPPGIPEFEQHCSEFVIRSIEPAVIKEMIIRVLGAGEEPRYPFEIHDPERIVRLMVQTYKEIYCELPEISG